MRLIEVQKSFSCDAALTGKVRSVMGMFGVDADWLGETRQRFELSVLIAPGDICFITGPSGGGKSVLLRQMRGEFTEDEAICLQDIELETDATLIDCLSETFSQSLRLLGKVGLGEVRCALTQPVHLSEGQKWRWRLAKAFDSGRKVIFADEFCSNLDRLTAAVVAFNAARFARQKGFTLIVASSNEDVIAEMLPDVIVVKQMQGEAEVIYRNAERTTAFVRGKR